MTSPRPIPLISFSSRTVAFATTALATAALAGCSLIPSSSAPEPTDQSPTPSKDRGEEGHAEDEPLADEDLDLLGKVTVGAPPEDLVWSLPASLPDGWELDPIEDEPGVVQVHVSSQCIIDFRQPAGMGDEDAPDSAKVAQDITEELGEKAFQVALELKPDDPVMLEADINDGAMAARLSFARVAFTAPSAPELSGTTYALRSGDFALIASAMCGGGAFASQGEQMQQFVESARVDVTY